MQISVQTLELGLYLIVHGAFILRALLVPDREPSARAAWVLVLIFLPVAGIIGYILIGEPWIARSSRRKSGAVAEALTQQVNLLCPSGMAAVPPAFRPVFLGAAQLAGCSPVGGNQATVAADSRAAIDQMVADFNRAQSHIHVSFYIWLADDSGLQVAQGLIDAARRGVQCRVIADGIGSRAFIRSEHWREMRDAGVQLCTSLKVWPGWELRFGNRLDLRNHRKIVVIDGRITWCGSQNCADPEFRIKAKYAPWVDIMLRFEGPVAVHNQLLFATDWMLEAGEDLGPLIHLPAPCAEISGTGFPAVMFGSGPTSAVGSMSSVFVGVLHAAQRKVVISTPYFVPDAPLLAALIACARRGVDTTLILPARNDSRIVGAISRAHYRMLANAGVQLHEFTAGLLHAKTLVVDDSLALIGSSNMDRRSLDLNFENNALFYSPEVAGAISQRQRHWLRQSRPVPQEDIARRSLLRQLGDNIVAVLGPLM